MGETAFPALLRYWRGARGLSQLDLSAASGVSARHLSFLESGRSQPSREMVLRLVSTLDLPLREQNVVLAAAGFAAEYAQTETTAFDPEIERALDWMMKHHEPFPLMVIDHHFNLLRANRGARALLKSLMPHAAEGDVNVLDLLFDPSLARPFIVEWEVIARALLMRLQRESMMRRRDLALRHLIARLCAYPDVPQEWQRLDLSMGGTAPTLTVRLLIDGRTYSFLTTLTVFQEPQTVAVEELRVESYFPLDEETQRFCEHLSSAAESTAAVRGRGPSYEARSSVTAPDIGLRSWAGSSSL